MNGRGTGFSLRTFIVLSMFFILTSFPAFAVDPNALPQNGSVVGGTGSISSIGSQMRVTQNSQNMIVNWQSFDIGKNASVNFVQPNSQSSALNRVMSADPSSIMGNLTSNGRVFLVNPSGVLFGNGAQVNVGSLVASTLDIDNSNFMSGKYIFEKNGHAGSVANQGNIQANNGGFVALLAPEVINQGLITARLGTVALAAGDKVNLDVKGDGLLSFNIDKAALEALADNRGLIQANGGQVILGARSAGNLMATVVNNTGVIEASSVTERNGVIILDGGSQGVVKNDGSLLVAGLDAGQIGGVVKVLGDKVGLMASSVIDASGAAGGGEILVGGNYQGVGPESNASFSYVDRNASIKANAIDSGSGGRVIVWANDATRFYGSIEAKGGINGGNGGFVETSGKSYLDFQGSVNTLAAKGKAGTLLLDPENVTISAISGPTTSINTTGTPFSPAGDNAVLTVSNLVSQLGLSNTVVNTGSAGSQAGSITVQAASPITWSSGNSLTLNAAGSVAIYSPITSTGSAGVNGGAFTVSAGNAVLIDSNITTTGGTGSGTSGGNISVSTTAGGITIAPGVALNSSGNNGGGGSNHNAGSISLSTGPGASLTTGSGGAAISALGYDGGSSNTISLTADSMVINGALYGNRVNFSTSTPTQNISLGSVGGGLLLNSTVANFINAPNIYVSTDSGNIVHTGGFTPAASSGGVFSVVTNSGAITDTTGGASNLGPGGNASNYILSGASIGGVGNPIMTVHSPILSLTSAGSIYVRGDNATGITSSLSVTSSSSGTGTFSFSNITNAVPSITTGSSLYTISGVNTGSAMSFSFAGNAPVNVGTGTTGLSSNGGNLSVTTSGVGSNLAVLSGGGGVVTSGAGSVALSSGGSTSINNNINSGSGGINLTGAGGILYSAGTIQAANNGSISFNSATTLAAPLTTNSGSGNTSFMSTIAGGTNAITINSTGTTLFNSTVGAGSLTTDIGGTVQLNGSITTSGTQTYNEVAQVQSGIVLTTSNSNVTFASTLDSQAAENNPLTVATGAGAVVMGGTIGASQALGSLAINSAAGSGAITLANIGGSTAAGVTGATSLGNASSTSLTFSGTTYNTSGSQTYAASAGQNISMAAGASTAFTSSNAAIAFNTANIQLDNGSNLVVSSNGGAISALKIDGNSSEDVNLNAGTGTVAVGAIGTQTTNGINTVELASSSGVILNGNITTDNAVGNSVSVTGPATLGTGISINTVNGVGGVSFSSTIDGAQSLAILAGQGDIALAGNVGATSSLTQLTASAADISLRSVKTSGIQTYTGTGTIYTNGSYVSAGSTIAFSGNTILNSNTAIDTTNGGAVASGAAVAFSGTINADAISAPSAPSALGLTAGSVGDITFGGVLGGNNALGAVTLTSLRNTTVPTFNASSLTQLSGTGITNLNGLVTTTGKVDLTGTTFNVASGINAGGYIAFVNSGLLTVANNLTAGAAGFSQAGSGLNNIGGNITTAGGDITFATGITLTTDVLMSSGASRSGNVTFNGAVDGAKSLVVNAGGTTTFGVVVGGTTALTSVTTDAPGTTAINGGAITTTAVQTYNDAVTLGANAVLTGVNVSLASTVNGARSLVVNDAGQTLLIGEIGQVTPLVNLTVNTAGGLVLPKATLTGNMSLTTGGAVTQVGAVVVEQNTHIDAGSNPITLTNGANDFIGVMGSLDGTSVGVKGTVVSINGSNDINLGQIAATAGSITINAGASIYRGLTGVTNVSSTAASMLGGNGGVVGTTSTPITVNLPSVTVNATKDQSGVSIDLTGAVGDNMIWLAQTPPGLVFLNDMILNAGQVPGVSQNAYSTALTVLDQAYLTGNGNVINSMPYTTAETLSDAMYPGDNVNKDFSYGPYDYKLPAGINIKGGGVKLPAGL
jgi:filamentous hemagglutinin family protein